MFLLYQNLNVGAPGFEPGVTCSQNKHVSRYTTPRKTPKLTQKPIKHRAKTNVGYISTVVAISKLFSYSSKMWAYPIKNPLTATGLEDYNLNTS